VKLQSVHSRACLFCSLFCCRRKCKISPHCCCRQFHRFASRCPLPFLQSGPRNRRVSCIERRLCSMVWVGAQPVRSLNKDHSLASCIGERNLAPKRRNVDTNPIAKQPTRQRERKARPHSKQATPGGRSTRARCIRVLRCAFLWPGASFHGAQIKV
jgi:hypothetical protein